MISNSECYVTEALEDDGDSSHVTTTKYFSFENFSEVGGNLVRKSGDENPFAEAYLIKKSVDDGFSKRV